MLTCKGLVAQSSDLLDGSLSFRQRLAARTHLAICFHCRRFIRQMRISQRVIRTLPEAPPPDLEHLLRAISEQRAAQSDDHNER
ncbi:MAG: zf-HC2 domain-containing protein [Pseudomonas neustonica]|mgnify:CR=1 FL=1